MSKLSDFFSSRKEVIVNFFSKGEKPIPLDASKDKNFFPCDYIKHEECVYWNVEKSDCGIQQLSKDTINEFHRNKGIEAFKRQ
jgi:hypothetical protein